MNRIYFDYNATAPVRPEVVTVMGELSALPLNASSIHAEGRKARSIIEQSRRSIAEHINAFAAEVIFTASGTESNNWVMKVFADRPQFISAIEHSSVTKSAHRPVILPVTGQGVVDVPQLSGLLPEQGAFLVSVMLANNETGVIQPVAEIAALVHARGGLLHCDAAQALGKISLDFNNLGFDLLTLCAHKMGGPVGAAALVVKGNLPLPVHTLGGGQELNRRAGTENTVAIAGFAEAIRQIDLTQMQQLHGWLKSFEQAALAQGGTVIGRDVPRLPNTSCIAMPGMNTQTQMMRFDLEGIALSAGAACTSGKIEVSPVLAAMGVPKELAANAIRISGGWGTSQAEMDALTRVWQSLRSPK